MNNDYIPPSHSMINILKETDEIWIGNPETVGFKITMDEAVKLGLALMENGLHLKQIKRKNEQ